MLKHFHQKKGNTYSNNYTLIVVKSMCKVVNLTSYHVTHPLKVDSRTLCLKLYMPDALYDWNKA